MLARWGNDAKDEEKEEKKRRAGRGPLPAEEVAAAQRHEVDLAGASGPHGGEEHLIISFTEELESLGSLMHKNSIQMTGLH